MTENAVIILGAGLMQEPAIRAAKELGFKKVYAPESEEGAFRIRTVQELVKIIAEKGRKTETNP